MRPRLDLQFDQHGQLRPSLCSIAARINGIAGGSQCRKAVVIAIVETAGPAQGAVEPQLKNDRVARRGAVVHIQGAKEIAVAVLLDGFDTVGARGSGADLPAPENGAGLVDPEEPAFAFGVTKRSGSAIKQKAAVV